jgi:alkylhydroperoxidase family enzyme
MAWIKTVPPERATGLLKRLYDEAVRRAGKVFNIVSIQSPRPRVMRNSTLLYSEIMLSGESALSRIQREMIATAVSRANGCHY